MKTYALLIEINIFIPAVDDSDSEIDEALRNIAERSRKEGYSLSTDITNDSQLSPQTPVDEPAPGEQFEVTLKKHLGSLGLNVTVSSTYCMHP